MTTISTLHDFENDHTVEDILCTYFGVRANKLMHTLTEDDNGNVDYWADVLSMNIDDLLSWIEACLKHPAKFTVLREEGPAGWPECSLDLDGGVVLNFDWAVDD